MKILILAYDEVLRLFSTKRGFISLFGFFLIWVGVLLKGIIPAAQFLNGAVESGLDELLLPRIGSQSLQFWPSPELAVYWFVSLTLLPFLSVLTAADQTASDRDRGTLRYLVLRCNRLEIFFGRFLGQLVIMLCVVMVTLASVLVVIAMNSSQQLPEALARVPVIIVNLLLVLAPFIALMAMVSVLAKSARQATLFSIILWILLALMSSLLVLQFPDMPFVDQLRPGSQIRELFWLADWDMLALAPIPIVHTLVFLLAGALIMRQRDL